MNLNAKKYHKTLALYYKSQPLFVDNKMDEPKARKCIEQPWQHLNVEMWNEVTDRLCDIFIIEANA